LRLINAVRTIPRLINTVRRQFNLVA